MSTTSWQEDAACAGRLNRTGDWLVGCLVARRVKPAAQSKGGRPAKQEPGAVAPGSERVSARDFGRVSKMDRETISVYLEAWALAAEAGLVPPAEELGADWEPDVEAIETDVRFATRASFRTWVTKVREKRANEAAQAAVDATEPPAAASGTQQTQGQQRDAVSGSPEPSNAEEVPPAEAEERKPLTPLTEDASGVVTAREYISFGTRGLHKLAKGKRDLSEQARDMLRTAIKSGLMELEDALAELDQDDASGTPAEIAEAARASLEQDAE